jgi:hypothetical protein
MAEASAIAHAPVGSRTAIEERGAVGVAGADERD